MSDSDRTFPLLGTALFLCLAALVSCSFFLGLFFFDTSTVSVGEGITQASIVDFRSPLIHSDLRAASGPPSHLVVAPDPAQGVADVFERPRSSFRVCQALLGDEARLISSDGDWLEVSLPAQQLSGWMRAADLKSAEVTMNPGNVLFVGSRVPGFSSGDAFIPFGAILPFAGFIQEGILLSTPNGRRVAAPRDAVVPLSRPLDLATLGQRIKGFRGVPYQTGGNSFEAMDSAGLVYLYFRSAGVAVPRRASQLMTEGAEVSVADARVGDVLFLRTFDPDQPQPALLIDESGVLIEASPAGGVGLKLLDKSIAKRVLMVRRFMAGPGIPAAS